MIKCCCVPSGDAELGLEQPPKYRGCATLPLLRNWVAPLKAPKEPAAASVGCDAEGLWFYVRAEDSHIFTTAVADNEMLWQLGDVVELFVKPGRDRSDYWEIHIAPSGLIMDIHIPSRAELMEKRVSWEEVIAPDSHTRKRVKAMPEQGVWAVEACVPWSAFGPASSPASGAVWQFAVCRYNYTGDLEDPELSSTAPYTELGFHRYEEYHDLQFA